MSDNETQKMSRQEENWHMMLTLRMSWIDAEAIKNEEDRNFLMARISEIHQAQAQKQQQETVASE
jgi:hypothetical protein